MLSNYPNKALAEKSSQVLISKEEALRVWSNPKTKVLFTATGFETFEDYWKECEKINALSFEEQQIMIEKAKIKLEETNEIIKQVSK